MRKRAILLIPMVACAGLIVRILFDIHDKMSPPPPAAPAAEPPKPDDRSQIGVVGADYSRLALLFEILDSKNDNDPRLDTGFEGLTAGEKKLFRRKYSSLAPEKRNERGTIVYLLGKNAKDRADWDFLRNAAGEPPCLSLADCSKTGAGPAEMGDAVTLAYPALVALKAAERELERNSGSAGAREVVAAGLRSKAPAAARLAAKLDEKYGKAGTTP